MKRLTPLTFVVRRIFALAVPCVLVTTVGTASAQQLYSEDFDLDHTTSWTANAGAGNNDADFFFDYSTVGIPSAPHSIGGTTVGVKLRANYALPGVFSGISVSPNGQNFTGNYRLTFDFWSNFNGNAGGTANGTTQLTGAGIGTSGTVPQHAGSNTMASVWFAQTGDGGNLPNSKDYRAYSSVAVGGGSGFTGAGYATNSGVYAAGTGATSADSANTYYVSLGANTVPAAQTAITATQTGTTIAGAPAFRWHTGEILKVGNIVKYSIDGLLIFTVDASAVTLGGGNIELIQSDINSGVSTDPNAPTYAFGLFDNITVSNVPSVISVTATTPTASESGPVNGVFTLSRAGDASLALTVNYLLTGTASNGVDYITLPGTVTFAAAASSTNITVTPINDLVPERAETVILTIDAGADYFVGTPSAATVTIIDDHPPTLTIAATQPVLLEGFSSNRATVTITRLGATNSALTVNLTYSGTATAGVDFITGPAAATIAAGAVTTNFNLAPLDDKIYEGTETAIANLASNGLAYTVGSPGAATNFITDDDLPPGVTLFSDVFDYSDTATNWVVNLFNEGFADFGFDYSSIGIPEAPSSGGTAVARRGLKMRANETAAVISGLSVSPINGYFIGDYRLRFDMWLNYAGPLNNASVPGQTQSADAGVGTAGNIPVLATSGDCVWFSTTCDGNSAAAAGDYNAYNALIGGALPYPDNSGVYAAGTVTGVRDNLNSYYLPWNPVSAPVAQTAIQPTQTGTTFAGALGMAWHSVAVTKRGTNVTWDVDGRRLATVDITGLTLSENVSVGYHDPYISVTTNAVVQFGLYDNVRVESLGRPTITSLQVITGGTQVQVDFSAEFEDTPDLFDLETSATVNGTYLTASPTSVSSLGGNKFRAVATIVSGKFYRVKRL